jgi:hypothetical protein
MKKSGQTKFAGIIAELYLPAPSYYAPSARFLQALTNKLK